MNRGGAARRPGAGDFLDDLIAATALIAQFKAGRIGVAALVDAYGNFYHAAALDGHEGSVPRDVDGPVAAAIRLHAEVPHVLDRIHHPVAGSPDRRT